VKSKIFLQLARTAARKHVLRKIPTIQLKLLINLTRQGRHRFHREAACRHLAPVSPQIGRYAFLCERDVQSRRTISSLVEWNGFSERGRPPRSSREYKTRMNTSLTGWIQEGSPPLTARWSTEGGGGCSREGGRVAREKGEGRIATAVEYHETAVLLGRGGSTGAPQAQIYVHTEGNQNEFFF